MTEKPEASVLTARRAAQHFRLSSADDAYEHLYILIVRSSLGPSPPNAGRYTVASRFRCRSCERGYIFPRAPEQFVASPLCLVGYVRWDTRSDRVPPLQTIIFSSFPGRTPISRSYVQVELLRVAHYPDKTSEGDWHLQPAMLHTKALMCLLRDTSDQLVQSRKQKLKDGRLVGLFVTENQIDSRRISPERTTGRRRREKVLCVSRQQAYAARRR